MASICRFLSTTLKLTINREKSTVASINEITFLGFAFKGSTIRWSNKAFVRFKQRLKELTGRSWGVSMMYRLFKLAQYLRGWMGCFGIAEYYRPLPELDHWLRRRIRMCFIKQWRWCRTNVRELVKLGTNLRQAISIGLSRKGPWRLAKTKATPDGNEQPMAPGSRSVICQRSMGTDALPGYGSVALGTAWCGPACQVVWGGWEKDPPLPDYALISYF